MDEIDRNRWQAIKATLEDSDDRWTHVFASGAGAQQEWATGLVSTLWLLCGPDEVTFVESSVEHGTDGTRAARIVALTPTRVIVIRSTDREGSVDPEQHAEVHPRRRIRSIDLLEVGGAPGSDRPFPSTVRLRVHLQGRVELELGTTPHGRSRLARVYGSLLHDLD